MSFLTGSVQGEGIRRPRASDVVGVFKPQLAIGEAPDSLRERPVHTKSANFVWSALGIHGGIFILHHLTQESSLAHLFS